MNLIPSFDMSLPFISIGVYLTVRPNTWLKTSLGADANVTLSSFQKAFHKILGPTLIKLKFKDIFSDGMRSLLNGLDYPNLGHTMGIPACVTWCQCDSCNRDLVRVSVLPCSIIENTFTPTRSFFNDKDLCKVFHSTKLTLPLVHTKPAQPLAGEI